jgi:hypothetical protein
MVETLRALLRNQAEWKQALYHRGKRYLKNETCLYQVFSLRILFINGQKLSLSKGG